MTPLQQKIGSLEASRETRGSRINRWLAAQAFSLTRMVLTVLYVVGILASDKNVMGILALTAAYAILILLLWLHERFPPRL